MRKEKNILEAYESDISKHTAEQTQRVRMVWQSIPAQLARENKKFIYGAVRKGSQAKNLYRCHLDFANAIVALRRMAQFSASSQIGLFQP